MPNLLLLGAGSNQIPAIEEAHYLGIKVIAFDGCENAEGFDMSEWHQYIDIKNIPEAVKVAKLYNRDIGVDGVITLGVEVCESVGAIVDELKLPGISQKTAEEMTIKTTRLNKLRGWVNIPYYGKLFNKQSKHRYPMVVKTKKRGSAADGVLLIKDEVELGKYELKKDTHFEQYIDGHEVSTESIIRHDGYSLDFIADRNYEKKMKYYPYMIEDGCSMPTSLSLELQQKIRETISRIINCFKLSRCILKCDLIVRENNVYVIEAVPRLSGGKLCSEIIPTNSRFNIIRAAIRYSIGEEFELKFLLSKIPVVQRYYFDGKKEIKSHRDRGPSFIATGVTVSEAKIKADYMVEEYGKLQAKNAHAS